MAAAKRQEIEELRKRVEEAKRAKAEEERRQKEELRKRNEQLRAEIAAKEAAAKSTGHSDGADSDADVQIEQLLRELRDLRRENAEMEESMPKVAASLLVERLRDRGVEPLNTRSRAWDDFSDDFVCEVANEACSTGTPGGELIGGALAAAGGCSADQVPMCTDRSGGAREDIWSQAQGYACEQANMACGWTFAPQAGQSIGSSLANAAGCSTAQAPMCWDRARPRDGINIRWDDEDAWATFHAAQKLGWARIPTIRRGGCVNRVVAPEAASAVRKAPCFDRSVTRWLDHEARNHHDLPEPGTTHAQTYSRSWHFIRALEEEVEKEHTRAVTKLEEVASARGFAPLDHCSACGKAVLACCVCFWCERSLCVSCYNGRYCSSYPNYGKRVSHAGFKVR